ncbi:MAG: hypothetical protein H7236_15065 [Gemmatimonadaceae bacterium]|uniref:hypothetical protein n=1 Tax=Caulobacter sp. DWP3-1-3b2 TaxID=2804643 RepID=UPI001997AD22|nr:hypothetical protein [Caulobacter sp.]
MSASPLSLKTAILFGLVAAAFAVSSATAAELAVGQTLACAPEGIVAVVGRLDPDGKGGAAIASVSLFDQRPGAKIDVLGHIPVDAKVLAASCPKTQASQALAPDFEGGYASWRQAFESGKGGYFTISISEILDVVKKTMSEAGASQ